MPSNLIHGVVCIDANMRAATTTPSFLTCAAWMDTQYVSPTTFLGVAVTDGFRETLRWFSVEKSGAGIKPGHRSFICAATTKEG